MPMMQKAVSTGNDAALRRILEGNHEKMCELLWAAIRTGREITVKIVSD